MLNQIYIDNIINTALFEDINYIDVTTDNLIDDSHQSKALILSPRTAEFSAVLTLPQEYLSLQAETLKRKFFLKDGTQVKKAMSSPI